MSKIIMFILCPIWVCTILVLAIIDVRCMYEAIITFNSAECFLWMLGVLALPMAIALCILVPILMYNDFKD